jgi:hypothetical protein
MPLGAAINIIKTIDGRSAASVELDALRRSLRESPVGTEFRVGILRAATPSQKAVRLRDLGRQSGALHIFSLD